MRQGVVFAGVGSPLFTQTDATTAARCRPSSAGIEPFGRWRWRRPTPRPDTFIPGCSWPTFIKLPSRRRSGFAGRTPEVVKHVVSGLAPVGACREGALAALIPTNGNHRYYRVLFQTTPFPTDPIVLRRDLLR